MQNFLRLMMAFVVAGFGLNLVGCNRYSASYRIALEGRVFLSDGQPLYTSDVGFFLEAITRNGTHLVAQSPLGQYHHQVIGTQTDPTGHFFESLGFSGSDYLEEDDRVQDIYATASGTVGVIITKKIAVLNPDFQESAKKTILSSCTLNYASPKYPLSFTADQVGTEESNDDGVESWRLTATQDFVVNINSEDIAALEQCQTEILNQMMGTSGTMPTSTGTN